MIKIYLLEEETILMDLMVEGYEEREAEEIWEAIKEELNRDRHTLNNNGNYIIGELTGSYLKIKYNIAGVEHTIE